MHRAVEHGARHAVRRESERKVRVVQADNPPRAGLEDERDVLPGDINLGGRPGKTYRLGGETVSGHLQRKICSDDAERNAGSQIQRHADRETLRILRAGGDGFIPRGTGVIELQRQRADGFHVRDAHDRAGAGRPQGVRPVRQDQHAERAIRDAHTLAIHGHERRDTRRTDPQRGDAGDGHSLHGEVSRNLHRTAKLELNTRSLEAGEVSLLLREQQLQRAAGSRDALADRAPGGVDRRRQGSGQGHAADTLERRDARGVERVSLRRRENGERELGILNSHAHAAHAQEGVDAGPCRQDLPRRAATGLAEGEGAGERCEPGDIERHVTGRLLHFRPVRERQGHAAARR